MVSFRVSFVGQALTVLHFALKDSFSLTVQVRGDVSLAEDGLHVIWFRDGDYLGALAEGLGCAHVIGSSGGNLAAADLTNIALHLGN